jgi:hypothetical protein
MAHISFRKAFVAVCAFAFALSLASAKEKVTYEKGVMVLNGCVVLLSTPSELLWFCLLDYEVVISRSFAPTLFRYFTLRSWKTFQSCSPGGGLAGCYAIFVAMQRQLR